MKFDLKNNVDIDKLHFRVKQVIESESLIELRKVRKPRTLVLNSYYHVVVSIYAIHFGYSLYEAKIDLKRLCPFMMYEKKGKKYLVQTSKQSTKDLSKYVEWIRNFAAQQSCYIPTSEEYLINKFSIDREIDSSRAYL